MAVRSHRCRDQLDYIGGHMPYECVVCGLRFDGVDFEPGGRLADDHSDDTAAEATAEADEPGVGG
jgi:hypothetical protein